MKNKLSVSSIQKLKGKRKITMLTAYDYPMASAIEKASIDIVLVGDSLANVVLGLDSTKDVTMDQMIYHAQAVRRGAPETFFIADMPYCAYQPKPKEAVKNALRFVKEAGCDAVKIEWFDKAPDVARRIVKAGIPVLGHIGLTPQTADKLGGFKVQGRDSQSARKLIEQAKIFQDCGCFCVLLECVPDLVAQLITKSISVPTIGIGAGPYCDGQVLVTYDLLGLFDRYTPKFVKKYADFIKRMVSVFERYKKDVVGCKFPKKKHSFSIRPDEFEKIESH